MKLISWVVRGCLKYEIIRPLILKHNLTGNQVKCSFNKINNIPASLFFDLQGFAVHECDATMLNHRLEAWYQKVFQSP